MIGWLYDNFKFLKQINMQVSLWIKDDKKILLGYGDAIYSKEWYSTEIREVDEKELKLLRKWYYIQIIDWKEEWLKD